MPLRRFFVLNVIMVVSSLALEAQARDVDTADDRCKALLSTDFSGIQDAPTQVNNAKILEATTDAPALCEVRGYVTPQVGFALHLPVSTWNGKFLEVGCHGYCGDVDISRRECADPLRRGYACISTDMGHTGGGVLWAFKDLQAVIDWGYRASHVIALAGKALVQHYYGKAPIRSYFVGNSVGGRQGMVEAERFPWDFDGIIAGMAPIDWLGTMMTMGWHTAAARDKDGKSILTTANFSVLHAAVLAKCDAQDGLKDGIVTDLQSCKFDPAALLCPSKITAECLSESQVRAVKKFYSGPSNSKGEIVYPNGAMLPGSELAWGSRIKDGIRYFRDTFRYAGFFPEPGPGWNMMDFNFDHDYKRLGMMQPLYSSTTAPDLRKFKSIGGKLLVWHGWGDVPVPALMVVDYYETAEKIIGGRKATQDFFRLFMIPGFGHGDNQGGADTVDYLSYLEDWVERGRAPDMMLGYRLKSQSTGMEKWNGTFPVDQAIVDFTRPLYPYPTQSRYKGRGNPNNAENFVPAVK